MKTTGFFQNDYTFTISDIPAQFQSYSSVIQANAEAVINYLSDFVAWKGSLDFVVKFASPTYLGLSNGSGLLPSYGGIASNGQTNAGYEAQTGADANGGDFDAGAFILPNANGTLTNYGVPLYFDPSPDPYEKHYIPAGQHDFFSIYLHETLHAFGFWSTAQHGAQYGQSAFDKLTQEINGQYFFVGANTQALLGQPLPLATMGSRDHYDVRADGAPSPVDRGAVFAVGNYEENRWQLGKVDLAVLKDLGYTTANSEYLALTEQPDDRGNPDPSNPGPKGTDGPDQLFGGPANNLLFARAGNDTVFAGAGDDGVYAGDGEDVAYGGEGNDQVYGGVGNDTVGGGIGHDTVGGGIGDDFVFGGAGDDLLFGGSGNDNIVSASGYDIVVAGDGADTVTAGEGNDVVYGAQGNDLLFGGDGLDTLFGGEGNDTLWGGPGSDDLWGGGGADRFSFAPGYGADYVYAFNTAEGDRLDLQGQTYSLAQSDSGDVLITLSGGGTITLIGLTNVGSEAFI